MDDNLRLHRRLGRHRTSRALQAGVPGMDPEKSLDWSKPSASGRPLRGLWSRWVVSQYLPRRGRDG